MSEVEQRNQEAKRALYEKQLADESGKKERKGKAEQALRDWNAQKQKEIALNKTNNVEQEK